MSASPVEGRPTACAVCGLAAPSADLEQCAGCGGWFHLELDRRAQRPSCGAPSFGQACGFSFRCDRCIANYEDATAAGTRWRSAVRQGTHEEIRQR